MDDTRRNPGRDTSRERESDRKEGDSGRRESNPSRTDMPKKEGHRPEERERSREQR